MIDFYNYTIDYDYFTNETEYLDYDVATFSDNIHKFIFSIIFYGIIFITGLTGNFLIILSVLHFKMLQSITNLFLLSLATADLLLILFCVPIKVLIKYFRPN
jgi:hypothetical protein